MQGYGTPIYTNITYPFKRDDPRVTDTPDDHSWTAYGQRDPVGSYRREFTIPDAWNGRQTYLVFDWRELGVLRLDQRPEGRIQPGLAHDARSSTSPSI